MSLHASSRSEARASIGYGRQLVEEDDVAAVVQVLRSDWLTQGPAVERFESALTSATGAAYAVTVSSGTAALHVANLALGVESGRRVVTSANTFLASATATLLSGGEVDFLDIDRTGNLDVDALETRLDAGDVPFAVTAVHYAGLPCDMQRLIRLKRRHGFLLIEDAAHALGARYRVDGRWWRMGEHPELDASCLSFHPLKAVTCGEGGAILTSCPAVAERARRLRTHGVDRRPSLTASPGPLSHPMVDLGLNYRLSDIHAALGTSQLRKLDRFLARRRELARRYAGELAGYGLPAAGDDHREHAWHLYPIRVGAEERDPLVRFLAADGIQTQVHYPAVPTQPWFRQHMGRRRCPRAETHAETTLSLPIHPALADEEQGRVIERLQRWRS